MEEEWSGEAVTLCPGSKDSSTSTGNGFYSDEIYNNNSTNSSTVSSVKI